MSRAEAELDLRERLVEAGHVIPLPTKGLATFTSEFERVLRGVDRLVHEMEPVAGVVELGAPPFLPESSFVRTGYVRSFPQLLGSVDVFEGDSRDHRRLMSDLEAGEDWTSHLVPAHIDMLSAPCHTAYPMHSGQRLERPVVYDIHSRCWRHEPSDDPMRLMSFRMREKVLIGTSEQAQAHRADAMERGPRLLADLGLRVVSAVANDPFFGRVGKILVDGQRENELKFEFVCDVYGGDDGEIALGSANYHEDHFGVDFEMTGPGGEPAHSACVGFGLERVSIALFATHGMDPGRWPADVRTLLRLDDP